MGVHGSKEKFARSASERYVSNKYIEQERFGRFGKRARGNHFQNGFFFLSFYFIVSAECTTDNSPLTFDFEIVAFIFTFQKVLANCRRKKQNLSKSKRQTKTGTTEKIEYAYDCAMIGLSCDFGNTLYAQVYLNLEFQ